MRILRNDCLLRWVLGIIACASVAGASRLAGQTLFTRPDTTPDYASYRYPEGCENAVRRLTVELETRKQPTWYDTAQAGIREAYGVALATSRRPDSVIRAATVCLQKWDADTAKFVGDADIGNIMAILLMAHRDQDAQRFAQRGIDSMRQKPADELHLALRALMRAYMHARPVRLPEVKRYYTELLVALKGDALWKVIDADLEMARAALFVGDTAAFEEAAWHAVRTNDAMPVRERQISPNSSGRLSQLQYNVELLTAKEGLDSISSSTMAYRLYRANSIDARIYGEERRKTAEQIKEELHKVPGLVGTHYYEASQVSSGASGSGMAPYTTKGAIPPGEIPIRNRINLIWGLHSSCHAEGAVKWIDDKKGKGASVDGCVVTYAILRRVKKRHPELELTLLASTYGTVGQLGPITPAEEADTLAKLWLGFHHIPARLVVEERPFYHVAEPDGRRIDLPTAYSDSLKVEVTYPLVFLTDEEGYPIRAFGGMESAVFNRFLDILIERARK